MSKSKEKVYQGRIVDVVEVKGGWTTILDGMKQLKVRNSELSPAKAEKSEPPAKPGPVRSAKDRKAPAKKSAAKKSAAKKSAAKESAAKEPKKKDEQEAEAAARLVNPNLENYVVTKEVRTASGRASIDSADEVATSLRGLPLDEVYLEAASATGASAASLRKKYEHLNPGMQRMNLGNLIRGAIRAAERGAQE